MSEAAAGYFTAAAIRDGAACLFSAREDDTAVRSGEKPKLESEAAAATCDAARPALRDSVVALASSRYFFSNPRS